MKQRRTRMLTSEDRILWEKVARTVTPLGPRPRFDGGDELPASDSAEPAAAAPASTAVPARAAARPERPMAGPLDRDTARKIARGRTAIEARIDLHGMTQDEAHALLHGFLSRAVQRHLRTVLVITGKGRSPRSEGVLKRAVPHWLAQPAFSQLVAGYCDAGRGHGGEGALYVRLRRPQTATG